jgi:DNA polymerase III delta prime subunit
MIFNPKTEILINGFVNKPNSSLILLGSQSGGVDWVIEHLRNKLLDNESKNNFISIFPEEGKSITVEQVRELKKSLSNIVKSKSAVARIAVINNADTATHEAQNALLKLIEEPNSQNLLILQISDKEEFLPTILSRCQIIPVLPITKQQSIDIAQNINIVDEKKINSAFMISGGDASLYIDLITAKENVSELTSSIEIAKVFLGQKVDLRLSRQKEFDKLPAINLLIESIEKIANAGLHSSNAKTSNRWKQIIIELRACKKLLKSNVSPKLIYMRLCVNL